MNKHKLEVYFFFIIFLAVLYASFSILYPYLYALVLAVVFAIVFKPLHRKMLSFVGKHDLIAALLSIVIVFVTVLIPLLFIGFQIFKEAQDLYGHLAANGKDFSLLTNIEDSINAFLSNTFHGQIKPIQIHPSFDFDSYAKEGLNWLFQNVGALVSQVASITMSVLVFLFAFYYLLKDGNIFKKRLVELSPLPDQYDEEIANRLQLAINSIVKGSLTVALLQGFLTGLGFYTFGISNPAFWGAVTSIAAFVPGLGTALVLVPAVIFLAINGSAMPAIGLALWGALAVGLIDNFIGPKLVQHGMKIHSFLIFIFALGGLSFFGPIGFILGPLILSLLSALVDVYFMLSKEEGVV